MHYSFTHSVNPFWALTKWQALLSAVSTLNMEQNKQNSSLLREQVDREWFDRKTIWAEVVCAARYNVARFYVLYL